MKSHVVAGVLVAGVLAALAFTRLAGAPSAQDGSASVEQLAAELKDLKAKYQKVEDVQELEKLQRIYGYYVERGNLNEAADLFSANPSVSVTVSGIKVVGIKEVQKMFSSATPFGVTTPGTKPTDYLHVTAQLSGVVDVNPDGKTAKGRWYGLNFLNNSGMGGGAVWGMGTYENDYIKEGGKWKILHLQYDHIFLSTYDKKGWPNTMPGFAKDTSGPPLGRGRSESNPFADMMPLHYKHPITGK